MLPYHWSNTRQRTWASNNTHTLYLGSHTSCPLHTWSIHAILYLHIGSVMRDLTMEQSKIPVIKHDNWCDLTQTAWQSPSWYIKGDQPSNTQHNHCLVSDFHLLNLYNHCNMHMSWDCRQSHLKALQNTLGICNKAHTITTRCGDHVPAILDSAPLNLVPPDQTMPRGEMNTVKKLTIALPWLSC